MGGWNDVLREIHNTQSQYDSVRTKYLKKFNKVTGRNVIAYYSSWLNKPGINGLDISDNDMNGFMNCVHEMDCSKGLDLILHTPGGDPAAAEAIVHYLRSKFDSDIRVFVPQLAMSAGTMIACAAKVIFMGKESSLGPIDPQFNGIPAYNIKSEFEEAKRDLSEHPEHVNYWGIKLQQYPAAFMKTAIDAIELSGSLLKEWLGTCMFNAADPDDTEIIDKIVENLNEHNSSKNHGRHLNADFCKNIGLKISMFESDSKIQDAVLSLHHSYMITMDSLPIVKIIESQNNKSRITTINNMR